MYGLDWVRLSKLLSLGACYLGQADACYNIILGVRATLMCDTNIEAMILCIVLKLRCSFILI